MRTKLRGKISLLFLTCAVLLAIPAVALADIITNNADLTVDSTAEVMPLTAGGANGTTQLSVIPTGKTDVPSDPKNGCNLTSNSTASFSVNSSNTAVATVSPTSVTFTSCGDVKTLTVTPKTQGTTTISLAQTSNNTSGTFDLAPATFTVNVSAPPPSNTPPTVQVNGVAEGAFYEKGSVPAATCQVTDAEDTGESATPVKDSTALNSYGLGQEKVTCSYTDNGGITASTSKTYSIVDTTDPVIAAHDDVNASAANASGATVTYTAPTANDAVYGSVNVNCTPASGSQFALGSTPVTCNATDAAGNKATPTTFKVTVADKTAPSIAAHADVTAEATGPDGANVSYTSPGTTDAVDGSGTANCSPASGTKFALGSTTVTCNATDAAGNKATPTTFNVIVKDTTAPVIASHADVNATATGANGALVSYTSPGTTDAVAGNGTANCTPASGTTFAVGTTTVTCNATDAAGNKATPTTFKVNVAYSWSNFLQPINTTANTSPYTQSVFKLGSTVPVKFNLTGASSGITDGTFYLKYIYTGLGDGAGELESVATTTGTTGTEFRYSAGQYIYNWSTKSVSKPGNYELRVYSDAAGTVLLGTVSVELKR